MKQCQGHNHAPGCTCGYNPIYVTGNQQHSNSSKIFLKSTISQKRFLSLSTFPAKGSRNFGTSCKFCGKKIFFVRHNDGCAFFDELGWPWPKHACLRMRQSLSNAFSFPKFSFMQEVESPTLCQVKNCAQSDGHWYAVLESIESDPCSYFIKVVSPKLALIRNELIILSYKNHISVMIKSNRMESQVQDCPKEWLEHILRVRKVIEVSPSFVELLAESNECILVKKKKPIKAFNRHSEIKSGMIIKTRYVGADEKFLLFKFVRNVTGLKDKDVTVAVVRNSSGSVNFLARSNLAIGDEQFLKIGNFSKRNNLFNATFPKQNDTRRH
jgi:hypothetical protein